MKLEKILPNLKKNVSLKECTTFKSGGKAKYFFTAREKEELIKAILVAKKMKIPFFIFGGGSNILVADEGFNGLVIKTLNTNYKILNTKIYAEAGAPLSLLVREATKNNLTGFEWAAGIPGTVGGAIYGNAGAFGKSMKDIVKEIEVLKIVDCRLQIANLKNRECKFGYRDSIFKRNRNLIILLVVLQLKRGKRAEIKRKVQEYLDYRRKTQPLNFPSAGSIFKNPPGFFAAELIEKCDLKGKRIGGAKISEKHANFILNFKNAKAKDILKLIKLIKQKVKKKFKIDLEEEIQYLGF